MDDLYDLGPYYTSSFSYDPNMSGFYDPSVSFDFSGQAPYSTDYLNFGTIDYGNAYPGAMPDFYSYNSSPFSGLVAGNSEPSMWDSFTSGASGLVNSLGGWEGLAKLGLGGLSLYGNYQASAAQQEAIRKQIEATEEAQRLARNKYELGAGDDFSKMHALSQIIQQRQGINLDPSLAYAEAVRNKLGLTPKETAGFAGVDVGGPMKVGVTTADRQAAINQALGLPSQSINVAMAEGGSYDATGSHGHGALSRFIRGRSGGQEDDFNASLSHGEYIVDADVVASLGDGNSEAGAAALDRMRENIREHKRSAPKNKIPPKAKAPEEYLTAKKGK